MMPFVYLYGHHRSDCSSVLNKQQQQQQQGLFQL